MPEWWVNGGLGEESWRDGRAERQTRGHEDRMKTASALLDMALDSDRCRFGPRRLSLSGTFTADSADQAVVALLDLLRWTLKSVYGANQDYRGRVQPSGVRIDLRAISTR